MVDSYYLSRTYSANEKLKAVLEELPDFCKILFVI